MSFVDNWFLLDESAPRNIDVALPCLKQTYHYFMHMLRRKKEMARMQNRIALQMKFMPSLMMTTLILRIMATKVLRIKTFVIGKISNQMGS